MSICSQEINLFQFESECILELEVNSNHDLSFIQRNTFKCKSLIPINIQPILIIITLREITTFRIMNSLTLNNLK